MLMITAAHRCFPVLSLANDTQLAIFVIAMAAGLGRAPATALAYMGWVRGVPLDEGYAQLTGIRRCSPKIDSIRSATADLLLGIQAVSTTIAVHRFGDAHKIQVRVCDN